LLALLNEEVSQRDINRRKRLIREADSAKPVMLE